MTTRRLPIHTLTTLLLAALVCLLPASAQDDSTDADKTESAKTGESTTPAKRPTVVPQNKVSSTQEAAQEDRPHDAQGETRSPMYIQIPGAPLFEQEMTPEYSVRRALGPFFEHIELPDGRRLFAVRPFYSSYKDPSKDYVARDYLWPLMSRRYYGTRFSGGGLLTDEVDRDITDPDSRWYWHFLPFIFTGQTAEQQRYLALFPLGGKMLDALSYDRIDFWLFPIWARTEKNGTVGRHWLFPIYASVDGPNTRKWHVWPIYGYNLQRDKWRQSFYLWPFVQTGKNLDPTKEGSALFLFPLYGYISFRDPTAANPVILENRTFLWPFFSGRKTASGVAMNLPWPFFQWAENIEGPGTGHLYLWPLYGHRVRENGENWYYLWPFISHYVEKRPAGGISKRHYVLPFYWHNLQEDENGDRIETYQRFWPFLSYTHRPKDGTTQVRVLDIVPMRRAEVLDRNLRPFWTFYTYNADENVQQHDAFWGAFHRRVRHGKLEKHTLFPLFSERVDQKTGIKRFDVLTGLFGTESYPTGQRRIKLFWALKLGLDYPPTQHVLPDITVPGAEAEGGESDTDAPAPSEPKARRLWPPSIFFQ